MILAVTHFFASEYAHNQYYPQASYIRRTLVGKRIVDHADVVGSIACRRCSNYIFIPDLTPGFNKLRKGNSKKRQ